MRRYLGIIIICISAFFIHTEKVQAGVYDNAYTFYQTYQNEMIFLSGKNNQGEIYYATKAKKDSAAGIRYVTLGWQVRLFNGQGVLVETLYYQLGGSNMEEINSYDKDGYEYHLYCVTLENMKQRMSDASKEALKHSGCNIIFDACTTTRINGKIQGGMTDQGPSWGVVYNTYNGIVNAQKWSAATKESLKSYYNKSVNGIFFEVKLSKGDGIVQVSGEGTYLFGTSVTVEATTADGYSFSNWTGSKESQSEKYSFTLYAENISLLAKANPNTYYLKFDATGGKGDIATVKVDYTDTVFLPKDGFLKEDAVLTGWRILNDKEAYSFSKGQKIEVKNLVHRLKVQNENGAILLFCANWDGGPRINATEIYVSLSDAKKGIITEEWIARWANAVDEEDGVIPYGKNAINSFILVDFKETDFTMFTSEGMVTQSFLACDSAGNSSYKRIRIYIVDTETHDANTWNGQVRFLSKRYFRDDEGELVKEENGGLWNTSVWRWDEEYQGLLNQLFQ